VMPATDTMARDVPRRDVRFLNDARIQVADERLGRIFEDLLGRMEDSVKPLRSVRSVRLRRSSKTEGLAGMTRWSEASRTQTIVFYSSTLNLLSNRACAAVMVHELAHAWLNEHVFPDQSPRRERQADELATGWGFQIELQQLGREAENIGESVY